MTADGRIVDFLLMLLSCSSVAVKSGIKWTEVCFWFSLEDPRTPFSLSLSLSAFPLPAAFPSRNMARFII